MMRAGILNYRDYRYLWIALVLSVASSALYLSQYSADTPRGNTWQGYVLGTFGGVGILWLAYLGVRRRRYLSGGAPVLAWTSAHVYVGLLVLFVSTLHSSARITWTLHGLTYLLALAVTVSGIFGVAVYLFCPTVSTRNRRDTPRSEMFAELLDLNRKVRALARRCPPRVSAAVSSAVDHSAVGGGVWAQLSGLDRSRYEAIEDVRGSQRVKWIRNPGQRAIMAYVAQRIPQAAKSSEAQALQELLPLLSRRQAVLQTIRADIRLLSLMSIWLYVHVPLTVALIGALAAHIVSVFIYW